MEGFTNTTTTPTVTVIGNSTIEWKEDLLMMLAFFNLDRQFYYRMEGY